jgi:ribosomal protein L37AE/L43A
MQQYRCERCGGAGTVRLASVGAWLCAECATAIGYERRHALSQQAGRVSLSVAPPVIRRMEYHAIPHLRLN